MMVLGLDPGDVHVGWGYHDGDPARRELETGEWLPMEACREVKSRIYAQTVDELVIEEYRLYDKNYADQAWSPFKTVQLIGALKWIVVEYEDARLKIGDPEMRPVAVVEQGATIKKATRAQLPRRGIVQRGPSIHARDAELHVWKRVLNEQEKSK